LKINVSTHQTITRQSPDNHQTITRQSPDNHQTITRQSPDNHMKHNDKLSRKIILTLYLSLSILFTFILSVETNVNVTDIITIYSNSTKAPTTDSPSSPYNERVIVILGYFGLSLIVVFPVLMCMLCIYRMKGTAPCDFKAACCSCC
jgi:hypothetical protein